MIAVIFLADSELHQGVRLVRIFLSGSQLKLLSSGERQSNTFSGSTSENVEATESPSCTDDPEVATTKESSEKGMDNHGLQTDSESISDYQTSKYKAESSYDDLLSSDLLNAEQEVFDNKSTELTVDDLVTKTNSSDEHSDFTAAVKSVKLQDDVEEDENANKNEGVLTLSELSPAPDKAPSTDRTLNFGSPQSSEMKPENAKQKKKKTILKSKPKNAKALPKTLDIFKAVKLKLKESKAEEKLNSLIWNANHSSSEELFAPATKPLSLIDLNTEANQTAAKSESPMSKSLGFQPSIRDGFSISQDERKAESRNVGNRALSPKSSSMHEVSKRSLNIADRMKISGGSSSMSSKLSVSKKKPDSEMSVLERSQTTDISYLSDSTKSVIMQKASKELRAERSQSQKRNVSFQEFQESESRSGDNASVTLSDKEESNNQNEKQLHETDLYIQSHSDILLLLFMKKDASQNSHSLIELVRFCFYLALVRSFEPSWGC